MEHDPLPSPPVPPTLQRLLDFADRHRLAILVLILAGYVATFTGQWRPTPDSALYLQIARNLARGDGFTHPSGLHVTVNPGLVWLTAGSFRLFGDGVLWPVHVVMLVTALLALATCYRLFTRHVGRPAAVVLTALLAVTYNFFHYGFYLLTDMPFMLGAAIALLGIQRLQASPPDARSRWISVAITALGVAIMAAFRNVVLTFLAPLILVLLWRAVRSRHRWRYIAGIGAVIVVFLGIRAVDPSTEALSLSSDERIFKHLLVDQPAETVHRLVTKNLPKLLMESAPEAVLAIDAGPIPGLIISAILCLGVAQIMRVRPLWSLIVAAFVAQWLIFIVATRYFLPILPLLLLAWWHAARWIGQRFAPPWDGRAPVILLALWLAPNAVISAKFIARQHHIPPFATRPDEHAAALNAMAAAVSDLPAPAMVVGPRNSLELTYLADRPVEWPPNLPAHVELDRPWFVIEPLDPWTRDWIANSDFGLGEPVFEYELPYEEEVWSLRPLISGSASDRF